jgi:hypothetical protein
MSRLLMLFALVAFANPICSYAQEKPAEEAPEATPQEKLEADPNDTAALNAYIGDTFRGVISLINDEKYDDAEQQLKAAE